MDAVPIDEFHGRIVRETFGRDLSNDDAMLVFSALHIYEIEVTGPVLSDRPVIETGSRIAAITQRSCSEALAAIWTGTADRRADPTFWYFRWQEWGSYARVEQLSGAEAARMRLLMEQLEHHSFVARFAPDDWDPLADAATRESSGTST